MHKKISHQSKGNFITDFGNRVINTTTYNDRVHINAIYCYSIYNNTNNIFLLRTRQIIYTYSCGKKTITLQYTPSNRLNNNKSNSYHKQFKTKSYFSCKRRTKPRSTDVNYISPHNNKKIDQQNSNNSFDTGNIYWLSIPLERNESIAFDSHIIPSPHTSCDLRKPGNARNNNYSRVMKKMTHNQIKILLHTTAWVENSSINIMIGVNTIVHLYVQVLKSHLC